MIPPEQGNRAADPQFGKHRKAGSMSTTDKIKNAGQDAKGRVKETVGRATGDRQTTAEGKGGQAAASMKKAGEKVKDSTAAAVDAVKDKVKGHGSGTSR